MRRCPHCNELHDPARQQECLQQMGVMIRGGRLVFGDNYVVDAELGRGGMGVVYLATDMALGRRVALKVVSGAGASGDAAIERFRREAASLATVRSPHVVQVYAFGTQNRMPYFAMEYVQGRPLDAIIDEHNEHGARVPIRRALLIVRQLASALDEVHQAGLVHRDVKPQNIVIEDNTGRPVLIDFGLSTRLDSRRNPSIGLGTPHYMAPEQVVAEPNETRDPITARSDIYSLGCTAFELLSGRAPFDARNYYKVMRMQVEDPPPKISTVMGDPSFAPFDSVLERVLAKAPEDRFASAGEFARALDEAGRPWIFDGPAVQVASVPDPEPEEDALRILIVDDDDTFRRYAARAMQLAFSRRRAKVRLAPSGALAIAEAQREPADLILLDFSMPQMDGVETLTRIRELPNGPDAKVIVVSANVQDDERWRFSILGVQDFVEKPIGIHAFVERLTAVGKASHFLEDEPSLVEISEAV